MLFFFHHIYKIWNYKSLSIPHGEGQVLKSINHPGLTIHPTLEWIYIEYIFPIYSMWNLGCVSYTTKYRNS